jgi:hypothetical protein
MQRFEFGLEDKLGAALAQRAVDEGRPKAVIAREALRQALGVLPPLEEDPLWEMVGACDGEPVDDVDEYLVDLIVGPRS